MPLTITDEQLKNFIMSWHEAKMFAPDFEAVSFMGEEVVVEADDAEIEDLETEYISQGTEQVYVSLVNHRTLQVLTDVAKIFGIQLPTDEQQKAYEDEVNKEIG